MPRSNGREVYVGVTDSGWLDYLAALQDLDEVNFWRPGGGLLRAQNGAPFLFKLKAPENCVAGVAFFEYSEQMSIEEAWEYYGNKNGAPTLAELIKSIGRNRNEPVTSRHRIGCTILSQPTFFSHAQRIPQPKEWSPHTQQGLYYDMDAGVGKELWAKVEAIAAPPVQLPLGSPLVPFGGIGKKSLFVPRLGQGTFRRFVLAAYGNRCAVSRERSVPVLEAAHIKAFATEQRHEISNGISMRADIHKLYDKGYVSVRPDGVFVVSKALAETFSNGKIYYALDGEPIHVPADPALRPRQEYLEEHYETKFKRSH